MTAIEKPLLLELPLPIITPRLKIVMPDPKYAQAITDAKEESLDILLPWMRWAKDGAGSVDDNREMLARNQARFILREDLMLLAFTHDGEFIASTGLHKLKWRVPSAEIGYWARKSAHGKGYVTEMANALMRYGFGHMGLRKIMICMDKENIASENVAKRLNLTKEFEILGDSSTTHDDQLSRIRLCYYALDTATLPPLDVSW